MGCFNVGSDESGVDLVWLGEAFTADCTPSNEGDPTGMGLPVSAKNENKLN